MCKKIFFVILFILITSIVVHAAQIIKLEWDPSASHDVTGYYVYRSTASGNYDWAKPLNEQVIPQLDGVISYEDVITDPYEGKYFYVVKATDGINFSAPSNEVSTRIDTIPPDAPKTLKRRVFVKVGDTEIIVNAE